MTTKHPSPIKKYIQNLEVQKPPLNYIIKYLYENHNHRNIVCKLLPHPDRYYIPYTSSDYIFLYMMHCIKPN